MIELKPELETVLNLTCLSPFLVINTSGKIQFFNQPARQQFKHFTGREPARGELIYQLFEQNDAAELKLALAQAIRGVTGKVQLHCVDQPEFCLELMCEPYRESDGEISGASLTLIHCSEEKTILIQPLAGSASSKAPPPDTLLSEEMQKTGKYLQTILDSLPMGLLVVNREGTFTLARGNDSIKKRYNLDKTIGRSVWEMKAKRPDLLENWRQALAGETFSRMTTTSEEEIFQDFYSPLHTPDGELEGALAVSLNITEQAQAQARLQIQNKYLDALNQVNLQMINQLDPAEVLQTITRAAAAILEADRCAIFLLNEAKTALVERAGYGTNQANLGMEFSRGEGMAGRVWETGEIINLADYYNLSKIPAKLNPSNHPARAAIGLPLKRQEEFVGALTLSYTDPSRRFGPAEIELLERLAMVAVMTLENARLYTTAQSELAQRKAAEIALRNSEAQLRTFLDSAPQRCYLIDRDYRIQLFNRAAELFSHYWYGPPLVAGMSCHETILPQYREQFYQLFLRTQAGETIVTEIERQDPAANSLWWEIRCSPVMEEDGTINGACAIFTNITQRKQAEEALRQSEAKLRAAVNSMPQAFYLLDQQYRVQLFNQSASQTIKNVLKIDLTEGLFFLDFIGPEIHEEFYNAFKQALTGEHLVVEKNAYSNNGVEFWMEIRYNPVIESDGTISGVCVTMLNISERKRTEQALQTTESRLRMILDNIQQRFYLIDREYRLQLFNRLAADSHHKDRNQQMLPGDFLEEYIQPENRVNFAGYFRRALAGENFTVEISRQLKDGSFTWWEGWFSPALEKDGTINGVCYAAIDITERKLADMRLKASLIEKEVLLKEIHHRVKNNLQIISSLLRLQTSLVHEPATQAVLKDSQQRIRSMALIHEKLYQSDKLAQVDFGDYLKSLVAQLFRSYQSGGRVELELNLSDNCWLKLDQAIPCGLIINELVSNSLKYAFPKTFQGQPKISISLESSSDSRNLNLQVLDNGIGLPQEFDLTKMESLGLQLVEMLSQQLDGRFKLANGAQGGTYFSLNFTI